MADQDSTGGPVPQTLPGSIPPQMSQASYVMHTHFNPPSPVVEMVTLTHGQRGGYGWEIRAATVARVKELDDELQALYGKHEEQPATK